MGLDDFVPSPRGWNLACLILNVIPGIAGVGTIIAAVRDDMHVKGLIVGILQLVLQLGVIGYIWSIIWGVLMFKK